MTRSARRLGALLLSMALLSSASPVGAGEPSPAPSATQPADAPPASAPSVHGDMLAENGSTEILFTPGEAPAPLAGPDGGTMATDEAGSVAALPNGLRNEVLGYLPYWVMTSAQLKELNYDLVSTIAYFSVGANRDGTLAKSAGGKPTAGWAGWTSSAMTGVINRAHRDGVRVVLTVTMMAWNRDYTAMSALLTSITNRNRLATEIANAVKARNADGVNLDFEPMPNSLQSAYTTFVRQVKSELVRVGAGRYLTVATTGGAASWDEGYDLRGLTADGAANALMVMAYDFSWSGSARAGGVAPIDSPYILDSREALRAYMAQVPGRKLIWGVPYYGRSWTTTTSAQNSPTCSASGTCTADSWASTYAGARGTAARYGRRWDAAGQVPWTTYRSSGSYVQMYYDDPASLSAKYGLVAGNGLRGVGIWHLLMDADRAELWNTLGRHFVNLPFTDIAGSAFLEDIVWLADEGITNGCGDGRYCPAAQVSRDQMASFLARALGLAATSRDYFTDDSGSTHEPDINRVAAAGITLGCGGTRYCPSRAVTREQMASFLARGLALPAASRDYFTDDTGSDHEGDINRVAAAGITLGCGGGRYCPTTVVTREQMAAFLHRALEY